MEHSRSTAGGRCRGGLLNYYYRAAYGPAPQIRMLGLVLGFYGLRLVAVGVAIGRWQASATRVLANQLWNISPRDPIMLIAAVAVMTLASLAACYLQVGRKLTAAACWSAIAC
ncbi:MAG TPA: hypothetical protein VHI98_01105 [Vicinamibacterales bacterium]|nr:hypothetical protein [Vicinamibacterales bacterium]HEX2461400.1 hypothetical protein [Vicinamibacterales bacterium]